MMVSDFTGGATDESVEVISAMRSRDERLTWSAAEPLFTPPEGAINAMSVSLLRLQDRRLAALFWGAHEH